MTSYRKESPSEKTAAQSSCTSLPRIRKSLQGQSEGQKNAEESYRRIKDISRYPSVPSLDDQSQNSRRRFKGEQIEAIVNQQKRIGLRNRDRHQQTFESIKVGLDESRLFTEPAETQSRNIPTRLTNKWTVADRESSMERLSPYAGQTRIIMPNAKSRNR